jgi:hypothetical protein
VEPLLDWFFQYSDAQIGMRSSWNSLVVQSCYGASYSDPDPYTDNLLDAISEKRILEKAYFALSIEHQNILYAHYGWNISINPVVWKGFQPFYYLALFYNSEEELISIVRQRNIIHRQKVIDYCKAKLIEASQSYYDLLTPKQIKSTKRRKR